MLDGQRTNVSDRANTIPPTLKPPALEIFSQLSMTDAESLGMLMEMNEGPAARAIRPDLFSLNIKGRMHNYRPVAEVGTDCAACGSRPMIVAMTERRSFLGLRQHLAELHCPRCGAFTWLEQGLSVSILYYGTGLHRTGHLGDGTTVRECMHNGRPLEDALASPSFRIT